jgi:xylan 1,4-beta-xylosidase
MKNIILFLSVFLFSLTLPAQNAVLPGDYPDPSVTKAGNTYWASATTSNWFPGYPLLRSTDLLHWQTAGFVFDDLPEWADYYFWAPEMSYENGRMYVYYSAHKRGGNLCVGIASADRPEGPYRDHGPIICQEVGSIDAFPMRDENGKLYMIWKEDANSVQQPTPIWIQPLNEERTALTGERRELFRNTEGWEANLVEGVSMLRHGDYYYAFYAGAGCCGRGCSYASGIARAKNLLGPWEKYPGNPVIKDSGNWKCPGHGTPVEKNGRHYFLYHAYAKDGDVYTGRQGVLSEFRFTSDGWIEFVNNGTPVTVENQIPAMLIDGFSGAKLSPLWQWSVFQKPQARVAGGVLTLEGRDKGPGMFVGQKTYTADYAAQTAVWINRSDAAAGLAAIGDDDNAIGVAVENGRLKVSRWERGVETVAHTAALPYRKKVHLRMDVKNGNEIRFSYSAFGKNWKPLNPQPVDGSYLPPWDRAVRAGLTARGTAGQKAVFDSFNLTSKR